MSYTVLFLKNTQKGQQVVGIEDHFEKPSDDHCHSLCEALGGDYFDISRREDQ